MANSRSVNHAEYDFSVFAVGYASVGGDAAEAVLTEMDLSFEQTTLTLSAINMIARGFGCRL